MSLDDSVPSEKYQLLNWTSAYGPLPVGWRFRRLGDFVEERQEFSTDNTAYPLHSFTIESGVTPKTERYEREFLLRDAETNEYKVVRKDDLIFNPMNIRFGAIDVYFGSAPVTVSAYYTIARPIAQDIDLRFLRAYLKSPRLIDVYHRFATGSLIEKRRVHWSVFKEIYVALPPVDQQIAIADVLDTWDGAIETVEKLIDNSLARKRALLHWFFSSDEARSWPETNLGSLGEFRKGKGISREQIVPNGLPCLTYGEIYTRHETAIKTFYSHIPSALAPDTTPLHRGDLLFAGSGETAEEIGKCVAFLHDYPAYAGGDIVILAPRRVDSLFLAYQLNDNNVIRQRVRYAQGHSVVHISATHLAKIKLRLPPLHTQRTIATVLSDLDRLIDNLVEQKHLLANEKRALMQQLLTDKRRVNVPKEKEVA